MLKQRTLTMSIKELNRCEILKMTDEKRITQREGATRIGVTEWNCDFFSRFLFVCKGMVSPSPVLCICYCRLITRFTLI
jgi:hypothetical protein